MRTSLRSGWIGCFSTVVVVSACSESSSTGGNQTPEPDVVESVVDLGGADQNFPDTSAPTVDVGQILPSTGDFGDPCTENIDCESGYCVESYQEKVCTQLCVDSCPDGWICAQVTNTLPDVTFVCLPTMADLCKPCTDSKQCGGLLDICANYSADLGGACAIHCSKNSDCPQGFSCGDISGGLFCKPDSQSCSCGAKEAGITRPCTAENQVGICSGTQECMGGEGWGDCTAPEPTIESCNGLDDDCDGESDEGLGGATCQIENEHGICAGIELCSGAQGFSCSAKSPLPEACNGTDDDCDGETDEGSALGCTIYYADADKDGVGNSSDKQCLCGPADPYVNDAGGDCDDDDPLIGALGLTETCTSEGEEPLDEDCDGEVDEPDSEGCTVWYQDADTDGFGAIGSGVCLCAPEGAAWSSIGEDCDDNNPMAFPGAIEACGNGDEDCDGTVDEADAAGCTLYYKDTDADGFGVAGPSPCLCKPNSPFVATNTTDCNDTNAQIYPDADEICNLTDDDCDLEIDEQGAVGCQNWFVDGDGDGFGDALSGVCTCGSPGPLFVQTGGDCDDTNPLIAPGETEICGGVDEDCDGAFDEAGADGCTLWFEDTDNDGAGDPGSFSCLCEPVGDFVAVSGKDCAPENAAIFPGQTESCNSLDDNCNSQIDEAGAAGCVQYWKDEDKDGVGLTGDTQCLCAALAPYTAILDGDCDDQDADVGPGGEESCNGLDDDCDGEVDEMGAKGCLLWYADQDVDGFGNKVTGQCLCGGTPELPVPWAGDCDDTNPVVFAGALEPCTAAAECCIAGSSCIYGICVEVTPPCAKTNECLNDTYCEGGVCIPYDVGPKGFQDDCVKAPKIGVFNPAIQCQWDGPPAGDTYPNHVQVLGTPMVADFDLDSDPSTIKPVVVFVSYFGTDGSFPAASSNGIIRVLDGATCAQLATIDDAKVVGAAPLAIGDLDLAPDGRPEIVAFREGGGLVAFRWDAAKTDFVLYWTGVGKDGTVSALASGEQRWNGPTLVDITGGDEPEIVMGTVVFSHTGKVIADNLGYKPLAGVGTGNFSVVSDVDLDGQPELVTGDAIWAYSGTATAGSWVKEAYYKATGVPSTFVAIADFGNYPVAGLPANIPEVVLVGNGEARVTRLDGTTIFGPYILPSFVPNTPGYGGPPTIGDFDGDGKAEFAAAGYGAFTVFDFDCVGSPVPLGCSAAGVLWTRQSQDASSNKTGSSVFDFEADGVAEAVYADECYTRVYDGLSGEVLYSQSRTSCTWYENPVIADTDGDLRSEIVVGANTNCGTTCAPLDPIHRGLRCEDNADCPGAIPNCVVGFCRCVTTSDCGTGSGYTCVAPLPNTPGKGNVCRATHQGPSKGIRVYRDFADGWVNSRPIWNQHVYSITEVTNTGKIVPRGSLVPNWTSPNLNNFRQNAQGTGDPTLATDITVDPGVLYDCNTSGKLEIPVEVCNRGKAPAGQGVPVAFFAGDPSDNGTILCLKKTTVTLAPDECETISCTIEPQTLGPIDVWVLGDFGGTQGVTSECLEENNIALFEDVTCINLD
ncbi:MAG: putative metal-binding motif-containing protein [Myxococcales bacterium]|nr:putative metal-binding motif-containing protein [Myxococcales bacterium]